jgi:hypothetical protein
MQAATSATVTGETKLRVEPSGRETWGMGNSVKYLSIQQKTSAA